MLNFSNHLEHIMLLIDSEKEANHPGLENRKRTLNICLLHTYNLVQILPDSYEQISFDDGFIAETCRLQGVGSQGILILLLLKMILKII